MTYYWFRNRTVEMTNHKLNNTPDEHLRNFFEVCELGEVTIDAATGTTTTKDIIFIVLDGNKLNCNGLTNISSFFGINLAYFFKMKYENNGNDFFINHGCFYGIKFIWLYSYYFRMKNNINDDFKFNNYDTLKFNREAFVKFRRFIINEGRTERFLIEEKMMQHASPSPQVLSTPLSLNVHNGNNYNSDDSRTNFDFDNHCDAPIDEKNSLIDNGDDEDQLTNQNN